MSLDRSQSASRRAAAPRASWLDLNELLCAAQIFLVTVSIWGTPNVLAQIMLAGLIGLRNQQAVVRTALSLPWLAFPLLAVLSYAWSIAPSISFIYGAELLFTAAVGILMAHSISVGGFVRAVMLAELAICAASIASGIQGPTFGGTVLVGLPGSKNTLSAAGGFAVISALAVLIDANQSARIRLTSLLGIALGGYIVLTSQSATGMIVTALGAVLVLAVQLLARLPLSGRLPLVAVLLAMLTPVVIARDKIEDFSLHYFKKDPTISGRTYLWAKADDLASSKPVLGYGYRALLNSGSTQGLGIMRWAKLSDPRTFSFHHTFKEAKVDLGIIGLSVLALTLLSFWISSAFRALYSDYSERLPRIFLFVIASTLIFRAFSDMIFAPFYIPTVLIYAIGSYSLRPRSWDRQGTGHRQAKFRPVGRARASAQ